QARDTLALGIQDGGRALQPPRAVGKASVTESPISGFGPDEFVFDLRIGQRAKGTESFSVCRVDGGDHVPQSNSAKLEFEQFPQATGLDAADRDFGVFLIVHPKLITG